MREIGKKLAAVLLSAAMAFSFSGSASAKEAAEEVQTTAAETSAEVMKEASEPDLQSAKQPDGFVTENGKILCYQDGAVADSVNGLVFDTAAGIWYYLKEGVVDTSYSSLVYYNDCWFYVQNGAINWNYTDLVYYNGGWFYVQNGMINWGYTGLTLHNGGWFYVENGTVNWGYTGLTLYNGDWFYVAGGVLDWGYTGLTLYSGGWFYVSGGVFDWGFTGLTYYNDAWFYVENGCLTWKYTGLVSYNDGWFYVADSMIDWGYVGLVEYNDRMFYINGGVPDWSYSGTFTDGSFSYHVVNGTAESAWEEDENGKQFLFSDGTYACDEWVTVGEKDYHIGSDGYMQTGWIKIYTGYYYYSYDEYYLGEDGAKQTNCEADGKYLDQDGIARDLIADCTTLLKTSIARGGSTYIYCGNKISSYAIEDTQIVNAVGAEENGDYLYLYGMEVGKTAVTITDLYGQQYSVEISVACGDETAASSQYDSSLPVPEIAALEGTEADVGVYLPYQLEEGSGLCYEAIACRDASFVSVYMQSYTNYENNTGYAAIYPNAGGYLILGGTYYVKARTYRIQDGVYYYGAWSAVKSVFAGYVSRELEGTPQYEYDIYCLDDYGDRFYTGVEKLLYVKTDNPDPSSIRLTLKNASAHVGSDSKDDLVYSNSWDVNNSLRAVEGGYVIQIMADEAGPVSITIRECSGNGYYNARTVTVNAIDFTEAENAWIDEMLAAAGVTASMTPVEQMRKVSAYLLTRFKYLPNDGTYLLNFARHPSSPFFESWCWDSFISPSVLCDIAERIGGFDEVHNCYWDYASGTDGWKSCHYLARCTYEGEDYYFQACPSTGTNTVTSWDMVDLKNLTGFTKLN